VTKFQLKLRNCVVDAIQEVFTRYKLTEEDFNASLESYDTDQEMVQAFDWMSEPQLDKFKQIMEVYKNLESSTSPEDIALEDTIFER
jgi:hypothetical protein